MTFRDYVEKNGGFPRCRHHAGKDKRCVECEMIFPCIHTEEEMKCQLEMLRGLYHEWCQQWTQGEARNINLQGTHQPHTQ